MTIPRTIGLAVLLAIVPAVLLQGTPAAPQADTLPSELSDAEFWRIVNEFSEPSGPYEYENFVSNEVMLQRIIPAARKAGKPGRAYIGVGPEQNFTYALALEAKIAFVVDIRRQNMLELLLYKALFEAADNRADFLAMLFSRRRPPNLDRSTSVAALLTAIRGAPGDADYHVENLRVVKSILDRRGFTLSSEDFLTLAKVYQTLYRAGPTIDYTFESKQIPPSPAIGFPSFERMMIATDGDCGSPCLASYAAPPAPGRAWSFVATEENYQYVRAMQRKNLIIPLVGDFAGPTTIRRIGQYLQDHGATLGSFYVSNVEYYLNAKQMADFYTNVLTIPTDSSSLFLRFLTGNQYSSVMPWWNTRIGNTSVVSPIADLKMAAAGGRMPSYPDLLRLTPNPDALSGNLSAAPAAPTASAVIAAPQVREVSGRVSFDRGGRPPSFALPLMAPGKPVVFVAINPQEDGTFKAVFPGDPMDVGAAIGLPNGIAVRSIQYGSTDLLRDRMNVSASNAELRITLAATP